MYALLRHELHATYLSVGHRPSLLRYHSRKLVLQGEGRDPLSAPIHPDSKQVTQELVDMASVR